MAAATALASGGHAAGSNSSGLSSLELVQRRLEEDRWRQRCLGPQATLTDKVTKASPFPIGAGGGGARAAALLRSVSGARPSPEGAPQQPDVEVECLAAEAVVHHPVADWHPPRQDQTSPVSAEVADGTCREACNGGEAATTARSVPVAPATSRSNRPLPPPRSFTGSGPQPLQERSGGPEQLDLLTFRAEKGNFTHILHFLRDGKNWKAPSSPEVRASLRTEALYFGCPGIIRALDDAERADHNAGEPEMQQTDSPLPD